jgi:CheY-like chemotaxis protein
VCLQPESLHLPASEYLPTSTAPNSGPHLHSLESNNDRQSHYEQRLRLAGNAIREAVQALFSASYRKGAANMNGVRVLLADNNGVILERDCTILSKEVEVVGSVRNGWDAIAEVHRLDPDVLIMDISMPLLDGLQAMARLGPGIRTKVIFLTLLEDQDFVDAAFAAGASGYVAKSDLTDDLLLSIHAVMEGHKFVSRSIGSTL